MVEGRYALIIANNQYNDERLHDLVTPRIDAEELKKVLEDTDIAGFKAKPLINEIEPIIRMEIGDFFSDKERDDLLLLYFAGHGVRDSRGRLYLAVSNTICKKLAYTAVPSEFILQRMNDSDSQKKVLILDCCTSGAFDYKTMAAPSSMGTSVAFEGNGIGRFVMTATDDVQFAWEGNKKTGEAEPSVFTKHLIKGLKGEAVNDEGNITFNSLYDYVHDAVVKEEPKQRPQRSLYKGTGELVIARGRPKPANLPDDLIEDLGNFDRVDIRKKAVNRLGKMLDSNHKGKVLAAVDKLKDIAKGDDSNTIRTEAQKILDVYYKKGGVIEVDSIKRTAQQLYNDGKYKEAIEQWNKVLQPDPNNKTAIEGIEKAKEELNKRLIEFNADAQKLFENKRYEEAIAKWQEVLELNSENSEAIGGIKNCNEILEEIKTLNNFAQQLYNKGEYHDAAAKWIEVLNLYPENETAIDGIEIAIKDGIEKTIEEVNNKLKELSADTQRFLENKLYEKAIAEWERVLELSNNFKAIEGISQAFKPEAEQEVEAERLEAPQDSEISTINDLNKEARGFFEQGNLQYAEENWKEVLELDPDNREAIEGIEKIKKAQGEKTKKWRKETQETLRQGYEGYWKHILFGSKAG